MHMNWRERVFRVLCWRKNYYLKEKVCGGGVSYKALRKLSEINIDIEPLFSMNSQAIVGHQIACGSDTIKRYYKKGNVSLGIQRCILDSYLAEQAKRQGAQFSLGENVIHIYKEGEYYIANGYHSKDIVMASGARQLTGKLLKGQSIGYSGQICAKSILDINMFYYWYYETGNDKKYFWAFPIGVDLWNVGIWSRYPFKNLKYDYNECLKKYFLANIVGQWTYYREPKAEFLGNVDQRCSNLILKNGIGDFAGKCSSVNGGGIIGAIDSAIEFARTAVPV